MKTQAGKLRESWGLMTLICLFLVALALAAQSTPKDIDEINQLNDGGLQAVDQRQFEQAAKLFNEAIARWRAKGPAYEVHAAIVQTNLAQVYCAQGDRERCSAILDEALPVIRKALGERDIRVLRVVNLAAGVHMMRGEQARAAALFNEALPIERQLYPKDPELARTLAGLSSLAMEENRVADAAPLAEEALAAALAGSGEDSIEAATAYASVAEVHRLQGHSERAAPLYRKARAIYEKKLGPNSTRALAVLTQEGVVAMADGKLGTAEHAFTAALAGLAKTCPGCAYERISAENDLALVRIRQGKLQQADTLLSDILEQQEHAGGVPAGEIAATLNSLAAVRQKQHKYEDAERLKRRAAIMTTTYR